MRPTPPLHSDAGFLLALAVPMFTAPSLMRSLLPIGFPTFQSSRTRPRETLRIGIPANGEQILSLSLSLASYWLFCVGVCVGVFPRGLVKHPCNRPVKNRFPVSLISDQACWLVVTTAYIGRSQPFGSQPRSRTRLSSSWLQSPVLILQPFSLPWHFWFT